MLWQKVKAHSRTLVFRSTPWNSSWTKGYNFGTRIQNNLGFKTFKDQVLDIEAWVYKRLKSAGAVLVAKLVSGPLAYDDIWFGGRTRNPLDIEEFSTGSSAGPAACTSAGITFERDAPLCYALKGSSIVIRDGIAPTFCLVGRSGVMSISKSLDELGPSCRTTTDCVVVLGAIRGKDPVELVGMPVIVVPTGLTDISVTDHHRQRLPIDELGPD
ncbi:hypothetical protein TIFTF001_031288 [Ficus carica]|uniref:Amidase domain-containing protein n=1 Tax=Ficus carica TaxID=3494 RepID=A0AA88DV65_FICCA|nr:hypothetical protein TIFTF001_031288 [Ficus carica]